MDYTLRRLDKESIAGAAHLLLDEERLALKYDSSMGGICALVDGVCVGVLLMKLEHVISVRNIVVSPGFRRNGIGTEMLKSVRDYARKKNLLLSVSFNAVSVHDPVYKMMISAGLSVRRQDGFRAELSRESLSKIAESSRHICEDADVRDFFALSPAQHREFAEKITPAWPYVASQLYYSAKSFDNASSCITQGSHVSAACLISCGGRIPEISFLYGEPGSGRVAMTVLVFSVIKLLEHDNFDRLSVTPVNSTSAKILNKFCEDYEIKERLYAAYDTGI